MTSKTEKISQLLKRIPMSWDPPPVPKDSSLLELGLLCVLCRFLSRIQSEKTLRSFRHAFPDWNELRVTQVQCFRGLVATRSEELQNAVAQGTKSYLQEVFQHCHGFDLEFLRSDLTEASKFIQQLEYLGASATHYLLWAASDNQLPVSTQLIRVLDRMGQMKRTSSTRKALAALEPVVAPNERKEFGLRIGQLAEKWCDAKKPVCWECPMVGDCPHGAKVHREWKVQQKRLAAQRKREAERRRREEERAAKRAEMEARKRTRELERVEARQRREREREAARLAREKAAQEKAAKKAALIAAKKAAEKRQKAAEKRKKAAAKKKSAKKTRAKTSKTKAKKVSSGKAAKKTKVTKKRSTTTGAKKKSSKKKTRSRSSR